MESEGKSHKDSRGSNSSSIYPRTYFGEPDLTLIPFGISPGCCMRMMKASGMAITMEGAVEKHLFNSGIQTFRSHRVLTRKSSSSLDLALTRIASKDRESVKVYARRRRSNIKTDTYLLMEPGKSEEFVSKEELRDRLKGWLDNWPGQALPPDLAKFENTEDAVTHLVKYVCELEIDGDVGSIQWFEVRLE